MTAEALRSDTSSPHVFVIPLESTGSGSAYSDPRSFFAPAKIVKSHRGAHPPNGGTKNGRKGDALTEVHSTSSSGAAAGKGLLPGRKQLPFSLPKWCRRDLLG